MRCPSLRPRISSASDACKLSRLHRAATTYLPEQLGHVQQGLLDGQLVQAAHALHLAQAALQLCKPTPRPAVVRRPLQVLAVQPVVAQETLSADE